METCISFLRQLIVNNHKEWFDANRDFYREAKNEFEGFIEKLIVEVRQFDQSIGSITAKDCVFRIYRDVRFTHDKTPYKNHFGAYIAAGGRKSPFGGYYFHIEPAGAGYLNHSMWAGGIYNPDAATLKAIRTDIVENTQEYKSIIQAQDFNDTFKWFDGNMISAAPKGFPKDFPDLELIRRRDYSYFRNIDGQMLLSDGLLGESVRIFKLMLPFNRFMNRAIEFHREM